jgi:hypothetical protein
METTKSMSANPVRQHHTDGEKSKDDRKNEPGVKGVMGAIGKPFQKMRRRLTVTGSSGNSENIDGRSESKDFDEEGAADTTSDRRTARKAHKQKMGQPVARCAVTDYTGVSKKKRACSLQSSQEEPGRTHHG